MSLVNRLAAFVLALIVPPGAAYMMRGLRVAFVISALGFVLAHGVFWGFAALPGLALYGLTVLYAVLLTLLPARRAAQAA